MAKKKVKPSTKVARRKAPSAAVIEPEIVEVDDLLIEDAITFINDRTTKCIEKGSQGLLDIGSYVLDKFFDGKPESVHLRGRQKVTSFAVLADHQKLPISKTTLFNAVHLAIQERALAAAAPIPEGVTVTHRIALLAVPGTDGKAVSLKLRLLNEVAEKDLSVRQLQDRVRELSGRLLTDGGNGDGPAAAPRSLPLVRPLEALINLNLERALAGRKLSRLRKPQIEQYMKVVDEGIEKLKRIRSSLESRLRS